MGLEVTSASGAVAGADGPSALSSAFSWLVELAGPTDHLPHRIGDLAHMGTRMRIRHREAGRIQLVVECFSEEHMARVEDRIWQCFGDRLFSCTDQVLAANRGGKLAVIPTVALDSADDLNRAYTPGVGRIAQLIARQPEAVYEYTGKGNTVAIVTDGSAVLGLGDLGPGAALPVMEGKAALFSTLAGINAVPLCLSTTKVEEIVAAVEAVAPGFGGINLEDIAAPRCFEVEAQLQGDLDIPVFHDDQHGTAIVVMAALWNALRVVGKTLGGARIVVSGAGAAGSAVTRFLLDAGAGDVVVWVPTGVLHELDSDRLPPHKARLAARTNPRGVRGGLKEALDGADVFVGVSGPGILGRDLVATMAPDPIVFALANPVPEIDPVTIADMAAVVATGSAEHPNQINNVLAFPGVFRGALDARATAITPSMEMAAARALASLVGSGLSPTQILPDLFDPGVVPTVAAAVADAAKGRNEAIATRLVV